MFAARDYSNEVREVVKVEKTEYDYNHVNGIPIFIPNVSR